MRYVNKFEDCKDFKLNEVEVTKEKVSKDKGNFKKQSCTYLRYKLGKGSMCIIEKDIKQCKYSLQEEDSE